MEKIDLGKFIPSNKEIINELYQPREGVTVGNLEDLLSLPLNEAYANNKLRFQTSYKFTDVVKSKELQEDARNIINSDANLRELKINILSNDIITK
jgi:hypothetical protein